MQVFPLDTIVLGSVIYGVNGGKKIKLIHNGTYPKQLSRIFDYLNLHLEKPIQYDCITDDLPSDNQMSYVSTTNGNPDNISNEDYNIDLKKICYYPLSPSKEFLNNLIKRIKEI